jgi:DNA-directed RNA polymerase specialized sigma24 family protein
LLRIAQSVTRNCEEAEDAVQEAFFDIEELSISETCDALSLSVAAVKARLFRARLQRRERLIGYFRT